MIVNHDEYGYVFRPETVEKERYMKEKLKIRLIGIVNRAIQAIQNQQCTWYGDYNIVVTGIYNVYLDQIYMDICGNINYQTCRKLNKLFQKNGFQLIDSPHYRCCVNGVGDSDRIEDIVLQVM